MAKQINFTIVPDDTEEPARRGARCDFCAVAHTPFDLTLTFCDCGRCPERHQERRSLQTVRARSWRALPCPSRSSGLVAALQE
jgi:hypothetical protein